MKKRGLIEAILPSLVLPGYLAGNKQLRRVRVAGMQDLDDWDSFLATAQTLGVVQPTLSASAIQSIPQDAPGVVED